PSAAAEHRPEQVAQPAGPATGDAAEEVGDVERHAAVRSAPRAAPEGAGSEERASLVVLAALLRIGEDVVGLGDLLELRLGFVVAGVLVRVEVTRQRAVGLLDLLRLGVLGDAKHRVVVLLQPVLRAHPASLSLATAGLASSLLVLTLPASRSQPRGSQAHSSCSCRRLAPLTRCSG